MNLLSLLLGHYDKDQEFRLYRIVDTSTLLFKFTDVVSLFNLPRDLLETATFPYYLDKHQPTDAYITTTELASLAIKHRKFLLAELCKLKTDDYAAQLDESMLSNLPRLVYYKSKKDMSQFTTTPIQLYEASHKVKSEPVSPPPPMASSHHSDPMALDTMLIGAGSQTQQPKQPLSRRMSRTFDDAPTAKKQKKSNEESTPILPKPAHTVSSQKAPTLLAKRLAANNNSRPSNLNLQGKNTRNLTIYAPSYGEQFNGIRSAPLHSNFRQQQQQYIQKQQQPHPLSQATMISPATTSATNSEFAIPPIVPSQQQQQQQVPHTAHPSSMHHHFPPHSPQYPSSAYGHSFPVTSGRVPEVPTSSAAAPLPPKTPTTNSHAALQRQQFMQPFEHLFDTIETTRTLKSTLDDQIRRSSTLIQTLQASSTTIEGLVRNQIKEAQKEIMRRMEDSLDNLFHRINSLERRVVNGGSVGDEEAEGDEAIAKNHSTSRSTKKSDLVSPPTIVKSQNDIGPNEYHTMLDTLRERLDRLERQIES